MACVGITVLVESRALVRIEYTGRYFLLYSLLRTILGVLPRNNDLFTGRNCHDRVTYICVNHLRVSFLHIYGIWWSGRFLMMWLFLDDVVVSWWSCRFLISSQFIKKCSLHQVLRETSLEMYQQTWICEKMPTVSKTSFFDEVDVSWWCGHFLMMWAFLDEVAISW